MMILRRTFAALLLLLLPGAPLPGSTDPSLLGSLVDAAGPAPLRLALIESETPADSAAPREVAARLATSLEIPVTVLHVPDVATSLATLQAGEVDLAVVEYGTELKKEPSLALTLPYHDAPEPDASEQAFALAFRVEDIALCRRANELLIARALAGPAPSEDALSEDLAGIRQRGRLRMITRHDPTTYFLHRGEELGFEFELMKRFAAEQNLELEIVVPPTPFQLRDWLLAGKGDVIAASLPIQEGDDADFAFTRRLAAVEQIVAVRDEDVASIQQPTDLRGRIVHVRRGGPGAELVRRLAFSQGGFEVRYFPEGVSDEQVLAAVERGDFDVAVCDIHALMVARNSGRTLARAFDLGETNLGWIVRAADTELRHELDRFIAREYRGHEYNVSWIRYFKSSDIDVSGDAMWRSDRSGRISRWDDFARHYAAENNLDWRLVMAQMYVESRFDPDRVSYAGAAGLMQLVPRTATELGVHNLSDPEESIRGGATYLRRLIDADDPALPLATRIRFALAGYNAGPAHVRDARRLAEQLGLNPNRWNENVELVMPLLEQPEYYENARFGYCRGSDCVRYVQQVDRIYQTYVQHVPERATAEHATESAAG